MLSSGCPLLLLSSAHDFYLFSFTGSVRGSRSSLGPLDQSLGTRTPYTGRARLVQQHTLLPRSPCPCGGGHTPVPHTQQWEVCTLALFSMGGGGEAGPPAASAFKDMLTGDACLVSVYTEDQPARVHRSVVAMAAVHSNMLVGT